MYIAYGSCFAYCSSFIGRVSVLHVDWEGVFKVSIHSGLFFCLSFFYTSCLPYRKNNQFLVLLDYNYDNVDDDDDFNFTGMI